MTTRIRTLEATTVAALSLVLVVGCKKAGPDPYELQAAKELYEADTGMDSKEMSIEDIKAYVDKERGREEFLAAELNIGMGEWRRRVELCRAKPEATKLIEAARLCDSVSRCREDRRKELFQFRDTCVKAPAP